MALIEKEPLLQAWCSDCPQVGHCLKTCEAYELIDAQPTVTAEPKRGEWYGGWDCECSVCGIDFEYKTPFCPNCGARMENKEEKNND